MELTIELILLAFLTFWGAYFSASETALFSLSGARVQAYRADSDARKQLIASLLRRPQDLLVTIFMLNTLTNILVQNVASHMFGSTAGLLLKVGVPLLLTLIVGEVIPKYLGLQHNIQISYSVAPWISFFQKVLEPVRKVTIAITAPISRTLFFFLKKEATISREELRHVLKTSEELEVLHREESELVLGYLDLQDVIVKELMRPRQEVLYYDIDTPLSKLVHLFVDQECSRIPVCKGNLENVLGICAAKTFFIYCHPTPEKENVLKNLAKPFYIPENTLARVALRRFEEQNQEIALVVDEYGSISGLITREDIIEVVIGQIEDLRDAKPLYSKQSEYEIITTGKLEIDEFNEIFQSNLQSEHSMVTIGGWLTEKLGDLPKNGTRFKTEEFLFHVLNIDNNRIRRLYVRKLKTNSKKKYD